MVISVVELVSFLSGKREGVSFVAKSLINLLFILFCSSPTLISKTVQFQSNPVHCPPTQPRWCAVNCGRRFPLSGDQPMRVRWCPQIWTPRAHPHYPHIVLQPPLASPFHTKAHLCACYIHLHPFNFRHLQKENTLRHLFPSHPPPSLAMFYVLCFISLLPKYLQSHQSTRKQVFHQL